MLRLTLAAGLLAASGLAEAHHPPGDSSGAWNIALSALLAASAALYAIGLARLWKRAGKGRGVTHAQALSFSLGWIVLCAALMSPLDAAGDSSFAMHMVQHELLMVAAAPLLVLARPLEAATWGLPAAWRPAAAALARARPFAWVWRTLTEPVGAWLFHAVALWAWHVPALFEAALRSEGVHVAQHASFLASALCFWWSVLGRGRGHAAALGSLFTTMLHTSVLGALLTFSPTSWYPHYAAVAGAMLSPLEDQQLGGLVMWVPGGLSYLAAGLAIVAAWLRTGAARSARAG